MLFPVFALDNYKSFFKVPFLLKTIAFLIIVTYFQIEFSPDFSRSIGGPLTIIRPEGYYTYMVLRFLVAGIIVPAAIGFIVHSLLRWRHRGYQAPVGLSLVLSVLVTWAWGLLAIVAYRIFRMPYMDARYFFGAVTGIQLYLTIVAARIGYYERRTQTAEPTASEPD